MPTFRGSSRGHSKPPVPEMPPEHLGARRSVAHARRLPPAITIFDSYVLVDTVTPVVDETFADSLTFFDEFVPDVALPFSDELTFVDEFTVTLDVFYVLQDSIEFTDGFLRIRSGETQSTCEESYPVSLGTRDRVTLTYPFTSPTTSLDLRNPKFDNTDSINTNTRFARTRSGQLNVARPSSWPTIETIEVSFEALSEQQADDFMSFIEQSAALEIGYLDQEARQWRGFIINPSLTSSTVGLGCRYTLNFEFRGRLA